MSEKDPVMELVFAWADSWDHQPHHLPIPAMALPSLRAKIAAELAAAEERGRRAGIVERDALKAALQRARGGLEGEHYVTDGGSHSIGYEQCWDATDCPWCSTDPEHLAPRDSGKEPVRDSDDDLRALGERWTGKDRK